MRFKRPIISLILFTTLLFCELSLADWEHAVGHIFQTLLCSLMAGGACSILYYKFRPHNSRWNFLLTGFIFILTTLLFGKNFIYSSNFSGMANEFFEDIDPKLKLLNFGFILSNLLALFGPLLSAYLASRKRSMFAVITLIGLTFPYFYPEYFIETYQQINRANFEK